MAIVTVTDKAIQEFNRIKADQNLEGEAYLRVKISGGGCSGFVAKLDLDENYDEEKDELEDQGKIKVIVDKRSYIYLKEGVEIDYIDDSLTRRGFSVDIKGSTGKCGCGSSFNM